jgi:hypothetical protein
MKTGYGELNILVKGHRATIDRAGVAQTAEQGFRKAQVAGATPAASSSPYRSKLEAAYAQKLELETKAGAITGWRYEPIRFTLAARTSYRPDFMIMREIYRQLQLETVQFEVTFVEVKGYHKNRRDSLTHLKVAAAMFPCFRFILVEREDGQWQERTIGAA